MQWLYKANDAELSTGRRRPDFQTTSDFALRDGILCRSGISRRTGARIPLVGRVAIGDAIHIYHRQWDPPQSPKRIGTFRVANPGEARLDSESALMVVSDADLRRRLREAYEVPEEERVTGWKLVPAPEIEPPSDEDKQLVAFLAERNTLARYSSEEPPPGPLSDFWVRGFRCFDFLGIPRLSRLNLVTGKNNTGKTTLLEALRVHACSASPDDLCVMLDSRGESKGRDAPSALATIFGEETVADALNETHTLGPRAAPLSLSLRKYRQDHVGRLLESRDRADAEIFLVAEIAGRKQEEKVRADWAALRNPFVTWSPLRPSFFVGLEGVSVKDMDARWQQAVLDGEDSSMIEALQVLEPTMSRLAFVHDIDGSQRAVVAFQGKRKPRPLESLGAGVHRLLGLLLACHGSKGGLLLVDEIDTGLHYSVQVRMWELLAAWSVKFDVQIVATTHSLDCVRAFAEVAGRPEAEKEGEGAPIGQVIRLGRRGTDPLQAFLFTDPDAFEMIEQHELEVR